MALDAVAVARAFEVMLPTHQGKLTVEHNPHLDCVSDANRKQNNTWHLEYYLTDEDRDAVTFVSPIEHQKAKTTGDLWVLDWWGLDGTTPRMAAATLPALAQWLQDNGLAFGS